MNLEVRATGFRAVEGRACFALFIDATGFPDDPSGAHARAEAPIEQGEARVSFDDVPQRPVAVAVLHDMDGDRRMRTGLFGMPLEGFGVSCNPRILFGPPRFSDCQLLPVAGRVVVIELRYFGGVP